MNKQRDSLNEFQEAYGTIEELNTILGLVISFSNIARVNTSLRKVQYELVVLCSELSGKTKGRICQIHIRRLQKKIWQLYYELPKITNFVLPHGHKISALLHLARTVCRRAERTVVALSNKKHSYSYIIEYLRHLSGLLFAYALFVNKKNNVKEIFWKGEISI